MSLAVVFKGPEGLVLAADSRVTLTTQTPVPGTVPLQVQLLPTYFDNATKLMGLQNRSHLGIVTYGQGSIGDGQPRMVHGYIPEFEAHLAEQVPAEGLSVERAAQELGSFFAERWAQAGMASDAEPMAFLVAGYDDGEPYGKVFEVSVPDAPDPVEQYPGDFSIIWRGQPYLLERLLNGTAPRAIEIARDELNLDDGQTLALATRWQAELGLPIPVPFLPLQDAVDLATFLVDMTATVMTWTVGIQGVGGQVDVAAIHEAMDSRPSKQRRSILGDEALTTGGSGRSSADWPQTSQDIAFVHGTLGGGEVFAAATSGFTSRDINQLVGLGRVSSALLCP